MFTTRKLEFKLEEKDTKELQSVYALLFAMLDEIHDTKDPFTLITLSEEKDVINLINVCKVLSEYIQEDRVI